MVVMASTPPDDGIRRSIRVTSGLCRRKSQWLLAVNTFGDHFHIRDSVNYATKPWRTTAWSSIYMMLILWLLTICLRPTFFLYLFAPLREIGSGGKGDGRHSEFSPRRKVQRLSILFFQFSQLLIGTSTTIECRCHSQSGSTVHQFGGALAHPNQTKCPVAPLVVWLSSRGHRLARSADMTIEYEITRRVAAASFTTHPPLLVVVFEQQCCLQPNADKGRTFH